MADGQVSDKFDETIARAEQELQTPLNNSHFGTVDETPPLCTIIENNDSLLKSEVLLPMVTIVEEAEETGSRVKNHKSMTPELEVKVIQCFSIKMKYL
jgi:hypothetical protein